jgi:hypothetical protein
VAPPFAFSGFLEALRVTYIEDNTPPWRIAGRKCDSHGLFHEMQTTTAPDATQLQQVRTIYFRELYGQHTLRRQR